MISNSQNRTTGTATPTGIAFAERVAAEPAHEEGDEDRRGDVDAEEADENDEDRRSATSTFRTSQSLERFTKVVRSGCFVNACTRKVMALAMNMIAPI